MSTTVTVTITLVSDRSTAADMVEDLTDLVTDAVEGYVGEPDRPIGGATITIA